MTDMDETKLSEEASQKAPTFPSYKKRAGASSYGLDYQHLLTTHVALKLINHQHVKDFEITTDDMRYFGFDDLAVKIKYCNGRSHDFLFQIKYFSRKKVLHIDDLRHREGSFNLRKLYKSCAELRMKNDVSFILYTNAKIDERELLLPYYQFEIIKIVKGDDIELFNTGTVLQFNHSEDDKSHEKIFQQFYFFENQQSLDPLKISVIEELSKMLQNQLFDSFINVVREWKASNLVITKRDVVLKLAEIAFSPFLKTVSDDKYNEKCKTFQEIILKFDLTVVESSDDVIAHIWKLPEENSEEQRFGKNYTLFSNTFDDRVEQRIKALWYIDQMPLILKLDDWNQNRIERVFNLLEENNIVKKFFLVGSTNNKQFIHGHIFENLADLLNKTRDLEKLSEFLVSFQNTQPVSLEDLLNSNPSIASAFTTKELLQMTQNVLDVGSQTAALPDFYIPRRVRSFLEKIPVEEKDIHTRFNSSTNLICSKPGGGTSTLLASLANHWTVFVKVGEHSSFFRRKPSDEEILSHFLQIETLKHDSILHKVKSIFLKTMKIYIFLDGLDEVDFLDFILNLVKNVGKCGVHVWIACRSYLAQSISEFLGIQPIYIEKLSKSELTEYFERVGKSVTFQEGIRMNPLEMEIAGHLLHGGHSVEVVATPKNYEKYFSLKNVNNRSLEGYELLALKTCLEIETFQKLNLNENTISDFLSNINQNGDELAVIVDVDKGRSVFKNRSYAEYFTCAWLIKNLEKVKLLEHDLFLQKNYYLKQMFDLLLADDDPLLLAVIHQNVDQVKVHIHTNTKDKGGRTPLHVLCSYRQIREDLLQLLLQKNDISEKDELFGWNCIHYAIKVENLLAIEKFLEKENPSYFDDVLKYKNIDLLATQFGYLFLLSACISRNPEIIKSRTGPEQSSLLHVAVASKNENVAKIIDILTWENEGIDINVTDRRKRTALHLVLEEGDCVLAKILIERGADVNMVTNQRRNLLHHAVSTGNSNIKVIEFLIDEGIDINATDLDGATALHLTCKQANLCNVKVFLTKDIDINVLTYCKKSALHYALSADLPDKEIVNLLIQKGIDVNLQDSRGVSALHLASEKGDYNIVKILCLGGANINLTTDCGRNAIHYAANSHMIDILLKVGLNNINSNSYLRYKSGRLLVTVRVRHYGRGDVRSRVKNV